VPTSFAPPRGGRVYPSAHSSTTNFFDQPAIYHDFHDKLKRTVLRTFWSLIVDGEDILMLCARREESK
jgi:hypothetical protein